MFFYVMKIMQGGGGGGGVRNFSYTSAPILVNIELRFHSRTYRGFQNTTANNKADYLTLCILMDSSFWFDTIYLGKSIVQI